MQEQNEKRSDIRQPMAVRGLYVCGQVFALQRLSFAGWLAEKKSNNFLQSFMGSSSPVAAGTEAVIALAGVLKSSATLLQWLVSSAKGA